MPSARLFLLLGGVSLLFVGGLAVEPLAWTALGVDGLLLAAFALVGDRARADWGPEIHAPALFARILVVGRKESSNALVAAPHSG